ncbi:MAG: hypothetical protein Q9164_003042 [Protoblastenia rupestris]
MKLVKSGTTSTRKYRFESFNQRIAKLNIDPIRKRREVALIKDVEAPSFFTASLEQWKDLNHSENFTKFVREVEPLSQSLPQVLHYSQRIFDLLAFYIAKEDILSLQPLLSILSNFAHDLDVRFEAYFSQAVTLVATGAARQQNVEAIDWSFTCLAWLFKYLSRLLVPNLRPLFQIMGPFLGKEPQKMHTTRFAAEAMSFLVRKAAVAREKHPQYLEIVIDVIQEDFVEAIRKRPNSNVEQYQRGIMTLLVNAIRGVGRSLHSCGIHIYHSLITHALETQAGQHLELRAILYGVTISLVHHSDSEGLKPILNCVLNNVDQVTRNCDGNSIASLAKLLFLLSTVRKGTRIQDWQAPVNAGLTLLGHSAVCADDQMAVVFQMMAVLLQSAPLSVALQNFRVAMETITLDRHDKLFLPFCTYFNSLGQERFGDMLMPYFSKFITTKWENNKLSLFLLFPKFLGSTSQNKPQIPDKWQQHAIRQFRGLYESDNDVVECFQFFEALDYVFVTPDSMNTIMEILARYIGYELRNDRPNSLTAFVLGAGLRAFAHYSPDLEYHVNDWWHVICQNCSTFGTLPPFLEAILNIFESKGIQIHLASPDSLRQALIDNLHSSSHQLRHLSLQVLKQVCLVDGKESPATIDTMLAIESSPQNLQSVRFISMQVRKLASEYAAVSSDSLLQQAMPHFCFGMLTYKLSKIWEDAVNTLKVICETKSGEDIVSALAFTWLEDPKSYSEHAESSESGQSEISKGALTEFECSNLANVETIISHDTAAVLTALEFLEKKYNAVRTTETRTISAASTLALRVLAEIPHIAERRSRNLVPQFLSWAACQTEGHDFDTSNESGTFTGDEGHPSGQAWGQRDRKAMLNLFCHFTNPRALYKADDVFNALKGLLSNGDADFQRSAMKALFTWKLQELQPYQEHLMNILDDARFREEIAIFVNVDEHSSVIQDEHRATLMSVLLRVLYGKMTARAGAKSGRGGQIVKRKAVLEAIYHLDQQYLGEFLRIMLGRLESLDLITDSRVHEERLTQEIISVRKQLGLMNMMKSMLEVFGDKLTPFAQGIIEALLYCLLRAVRQLNAENSAETQISNLKTPTSLIKAVRHSGLQCLNLVAQYFPSGSLLPYLPIIYSEILGPRLGQLSIETAQSVSGLLQLFSTWASSLATIPFLFDYDTRTLNSITDCLATPSCKEEVQSFVIDNILLRLVECIGNSGSNDVGNDQPPLPNRLCYGPSPSNAGYMLDRLGILLQGSPSKGIVASGIRLVAAMAPLTKGSSQTQALLEVSVFLLDQPSHRVSPRSKGELLQILAHFLPAVKATLPSTLRENLFRTVCSLFGYFKDRENRLLLSSAFQAIAVGDIELQNIASLCENMNAYSIHKIGEPDFNLRLKAFNFINDSNCNSFSVRQWRPLLFNALFYVQDNEELAVRSNASFALRRFVEASASDSDNATSEMVELVKGVLLPSLRKGVSNSSELVRTEYLSIMAHLIRHHPQWQEVSDMQVLLVGNDDEASFFSNILHIQQHRRLRALRRLATEASKAQLRSGNVAHFLVPLVEHFIFDKADDEAAHNLSAESITTIGALATSLEWPQFKALFRRLSSYIQSKPEVEKSTIRLLGLVIDALSEAANQKEKVAKNQDADEHDTAQISNTLAKTMPKKDKFADDVSDALLPSLTAYLHDKDESTVSLRVPVAISIIKLLKLLPQTHFEERLPPMLTDVCNILRSRAQESRDLSRKTLAEIATLIGSAYFDFMLKELRSALTRGYQLHVLSFTMHSILVATAAIYVPGDLDYCLPQMVGVIMDDIFGVTGQEKDAEEYISKMKEVKSSKSFDSMELIAKTTRVDHLVQLLKPLQTLLEEKLDLRMVKKIDELLRRIGVGLLRNDSIQDQRILIFCYETIREAYSIGDVSSTRTGKDEYRSKRFLINYHGANKTANRGVTSSCKYKLARFAFDILRAVFHRHNDLQTPANVHGFIPIIGDAIVQSNEEIQTSALRLLTTIIKVPLKSINDNAGIYIAECVKIVKASTSTNLELAQAALKVVSAILRERRTIDISEADIAYLLKRLIPDLEEPDKQGIAFSFLKAVMTRKIIIPEVYEILDIVGAIMVTNQTRSARDMARGAYSQFIMDYPQSKYRFSKQVAFLVRNLDYKHQEGRQSVLEAINLLFTKTGEDLLQSVFGAFFVPLVMVIVNDESSQCREMAGALLGTVFDRADGDHINSFLTMLQLWLGQDDPPLLIRVALQVYGIYLDGKALKAKTDFVFLQPRLAHILKANINQPSNADWELLYFALQVFTKICRLSPGSALGSPAAALWASVRRSLSFPHAWVKLSAAKLLGIYLADFARTNSTGNSLHLPLKGSNGMWLKEQEIIELTRASLGLLRVPGVSQDLASQSIRNLVFLGKTMVQSSMAWPQRTPEPEYSSEEDEESAVEGGGEVALIVQKQLALDQLIHRSCNILRRPPSTTRAPSLIPLTSTLQLLAVLTNHLAVGTLRPLLPAILLPLHNFTDTSIPTPFSTDPAFNEGYKTLVSNARELMSTLQEKFGTTEYVNIFHNMREMVKERREGRRTKRAIERVANPEKAGRDKQRKGEKKRVKRKERSGEERGRRRGW